MSARRAKWGYYSGLLLASAICFALAAHQQRYSRLLAMGHRAVSEKRFDSLAYEQAGQLWLARQDRLLFNRGVLAYQAQNLPRAAQYFRRVSQETNNSALRVQALRNLGVVMAALKEAKGAAHMFKEALRLNPEDATSKLHLERLYHVALQPQGKHSQASLQQTPGAAQNEGQALGQEGRGRGKALSGI